MSDDGEEGDPYDFHEGQTVEDILELTQLAADPLEDPEATVVRGDERSRLPTAALAPHVLGTPEPSASPVRMPTEAMAPITVGQPIVDPAVATVSPARMPTNAMAPIAVGQPISEPPADGLRSRVSTNVRNSIGAMQEREQQRMQRMRLIRGVVFAVIAAAAIAYFYA